MMDGGSPYLQAALHFPCYLCRHLRAGDYVIFAPDSYLIDPAAPCPHCLQTSSVPHPSKQEAEVIFAPYSYLIDPVIRRAMAVGALNVVEALGWWGLGWATGSTCSTALGEAVGELISNSLCAPPASPPPLLGYLPGWEETWRGSPLCHPLGSLTCKQMWRAPC